MAQVAPSWVVDSAIYSEMKGGLHPWFTGLAVVGGVYVFGPVGAVYGPLALCLVYVLVNMYSTFMQAGWGQSSRKKLFYIPTSKICQSYPNFVFQFISLGGFQLLPSFI